MFIVDSILYTCPRKQIYSTLIVIQSCFETYFYKDFLHFLRLQK